MALAGLRRAFGDKNELVALLDAEKEAAKSIRSNGRELGETSRHLTLWGREEHADLTDCLDKAAIVLGKLAEFHNALADEHARYRGLLHDIHAQDQAILGIRNRNRELQSKIKSSAKSGKNVEWLQKEEETVRRELLAAIAAQEGFKRRNIKDALHIQFDAWTTLGQKLMILGTFGKYLADQIPQGTLAPGQELPEYKGSATTTRIFGDFLKALKALRTGIP
ncbi:hypothetical protein CXG81DRAFT_11541, partial [Caulochytrium protostelioides]